MKVEPHLIVASASDTSVYIAVKDLRSGDMEAAPRWAARAIRLSAVVGDDALQVIAAEVGGPRALTTAGRIQAALAAHIGAQT